MKGRSIHQITLDATEFVPVDKVTDGADQDLPRDERQHRLAAAMASYFHHERANVCVLLIGRFNDHRHTDDWWKLSGGSIPEFTGDVFQIGMILLL